MLLPSRVRHRNLKSIRQRPTDLRIRLSVKRPEQSFFDLDSIVFDRERTNAPLANPRCVTDIQVAREDWQGLSIFRCGVHKVEHAFDLNPPPFIALAPTEPRLCAPARKLAQAQLHAFASSLGNPDQLESG